MLTSTIETKVISPIDNYTVIFWPCREIDRKDLAVQMRKRVGDYSRVVDLLRTGGGIVQYSTALCLECAAFCYVFYYYDIIYCHALY